jgi:hypothetical protein
MSSPVGVDARKSAAVLIDGHQLDLRVELVVVISE